MARRADVVVNGTMDRCTCSPVGGPAQGWHRPRPASAFGPNLECKTVFVASVLRWIPTDSWRTLRGAMTPPRLITFRPSHYCEKARWALERAAIPYKEESHVPALSWFATYRAGAGRTVPVLVTSSGTYGDSTEILRWIDRQPGVAPLLADGDAATLEDEFDRRLGPATRRLAYFHLVPQKREMRELLCDAGQPWEARVTPVLFPLIRQLIVRGLGVNAAGAERSRRVLDEIFARVAGILADGRRYLTGEHFTAADLTFAALAYPVLWPKQVQRLGLPTLPPALRALADELSATPAGRFGLRLWDEERDRTARA